MNIDGNFPTYEQQQQAITLLQELGVDIDTLLAGRVVKSVQRGGASLTSPTTGASVISQTVNFSAVDLSKSIIIANFHFNNGYINNNSYSLGYEMLTNTTARVSMYMPGMSPVYSVVVKWHVIEFY